MLNIITVVNSADGSGREAGTNYRGPTMLHVFFVVLIIFGLFKITLPDQAQISLQLTVFRIHCKDLYPVHPC
jgi:hypothetical protein